MPSDPQSDRDFVVPTLLIATEFVLTGLVFQFSTFSTAPALAMREQPGCISKQYQPSVWAKENGTPHGYFGSMM
jgi:hypothetical protein